MKSSAALAAPQNLIDLLKARSQITPAKEAFAYAGQSYSYAWLWDALNGFAGALDLQGPGERVIITLPTGPAFFPVFFGVQRAGGIPVPLHPDSGAARLESIAAQCAARRVVLPEKRSDLSGGLAQIPASARVDPPPAFPELAPESTAYVQFTSGSTGDPKGVIIRHSQLLTNIQQMVAGMALSAADVFVSWLPVYHDMGLVLMALAPFYLGARLILLPTSFVNLRRWLATIADVRGTFTAAPDFGYRLALRYAAHPGDLDLSSLRVALNAAELVRPGTIESFEAAFGLRHVMTAGYGLAEATVGVSMTAPGGGVRVDRDGFVSVGRPFPGIDVKILTGGAESGARGTTGEILVRSPANTPGYLDDPEATRALYHGDGYIRTGDLGYVDETGELFIVARAKEMLKHAGRTVAPREVEAALDGHPELRAAAAISADLGGLAGEQVVVLCELRRPGKWDEDGLHALAVELVEKIHVYIGFRPGQLYLVQPRSIPLTANGKVQRLLLSQQFMDGMLEREDRIVYPDY